MVQKKKGSSEKPKKAPQRLGFKTEADAQKAAEVKASSGVSWPRGRKDIDPLVVNIEEKLLATRGAEAALSSNAPADPAILMFTVQLALLAGKVPEAGRAMGWSAQRARAVVNKWPVLLEIARDAAAQAASSEVAKWSEMGDEFRAHLRHLGKEAEDERVQLQATLAIIERVEGKVPAKIEVEDTTSPKDIWATLTTRFATSYHVAKNVTFAEALEVAEANPEAVREWGRKNGLAVA